MAVYKTRWFDRWARKQGLSTPSLCSAVDEMTAGLYEADLGAGLLKKRVARPGPGEEWRLSHAGRHQQGEPLGFHFRIPEE
jgi:hypothetical protein